MTHLISKCCGAKVDKCTKKDCIKKYCLKCAKHCETTSTPPEATKETHDKNGHKINSKGKLIFDELCYGCDAPKNELEEIAEKIASNLDGRTITSHYHFRELVKQEINHELPSLLSRKEAEAYKRGREEERKQVISMIEKEDDFTRRRFTLVFGKGLDKQEANIYEEKQLVSAAYSSLIKKLLALKN